RGSPSPFADLESLLAEAPPATELDAAAAHGKRVAEAFAAYLAHRPLRDVPGLAELAPWWQEWCDHPDPSDDYWRAIQASDQLDALTQAGFHSSGWYDYYPAGAIEA